MERKEVFKYQKYLITDRTEEIDAQKLTLEQRRKLISTVIGKNNPSLGIETGDATYLISSAELEEANQSPRNLDRFLFYLDPVLQQAKRIVMQASDIKFSRN